MEFTEHSSVKAGGSVTSGNATTKVGAAAQAAAEGAAAAHKITKNAKEAHAERKKKKAAKAEKASAVAMNTTGKNSGYLPGRGRSSVA